MPLWPGPAPVGQGATEDENGFLTLYRPSHPNGKAVVICPGGGYGGLVTDGEGSGIARWLNDHGITGIVLEYRLPAGRPMVPLRDAQRAIRTVRTKAREWGCDPAKIGIIGFSAGGHLAATAATHFDDGDPAASDAIERAGCRPDFAILVYPVITMGDATHGGSRANLLGPSPSAEMIALFSNELQVTARTAPTFLTHAADDRVVSPDHSRMFFAALRTHQVPAEYLELPSGDHGLNGYKGPMWDAWQSASLKWLGFLEAEQAGYQTRNVEGWKVHLSEKLLAGQREAVEAALPLLQQQLQEIIRVVPAEAVAKLLQVPLWFSPAYSLVPGRAEYHPGAEWLRENGRNPAMVKGVEFTDTRNFAAEMSRMPNFVLHELAHAYHDRELSFDQPDIIAAYNHAMTAQLYQRVPRRHGNGKPETVESAYATTNHKEYFAELTEAVFSTNDYFPFTLNELATYDPQGTAVLRRAWGLAK